MDPGGKQKQFHQQLQRFEVFCRDAIEPAMHPITHPLEVAAYQCSEPIPFAQAAAMCYAKVGVGWEWGPVWSTCWFRVRGTVPASMSGKVIALRFSTDTEALAWMPTSGTPRRGTPLQGLDVNRDTVRLAAGRGGAAGDSVEVYIEAACNHLFGDRGLQWDPPEVHRRWNSATPGRLDRCELATIDETVSRLKWVYTFALQMARALPHDSPRAARLQAALRRCTNAIPDDRVAGTAAGALAELEAVVRSGVAADASACYAVGHAHIDTAWLWPIRETRRKCLRTFASTLRLMERFPHYRFLCSQAQQYEWLEENSPELFAQVKRRVAEGRWEPGGAMWIEPDCNVPSGESLIRQILYADRYWRDKFGDERGKQRFLYLPDTFGFPPQLPQIMRLAGLDTFITNKLHWNDTNVFPHTTFIWRGLDGSEVVGHNTPGKDYNATMTPAELLRGHKTLLDTAASGRQKQTNPGDPCAIPWLQPFGFGDGGGGPTEWNILNAQLAAGSEGLPSVRFSSVGEFCDALHAGVTEARAIDAARVPVYEGELYLELHRGTLTTHARIKQANAECEELLRQAEILTFAGPTRISADENKAARTTLDRAWKLLLLNQFHDILPGSSIAWVYQDAERDYAEIRELARPLIERGMGKWAQSLTSVDEAEPACLFNLSNGSPGAFDRVDDRVVAVHTAAPMSVRVVDRASLNSTIAEIPIEGDLLISREGLRLSHRWFAMEFDRAGRIEWMQVSQEGGNAGDVPAISGQDPDSVAINQVALYEDRPRLWDAWDIDAEHIEKAEHFTTDCDHEFVCDTPERVSIRFTRRFGRDSRISQTFTLLAANKHVTVDTEVDWREEHRLLRVLFPVAPGAESVRVGTQFGYRDVATDRSSAIAAAAFEIPFHRFMSDQTSGLSLAFPDRHGASVRERVMGVSLLRASRYPDPTADIGLHRFRYAISADEAFAEWGRQAEAFVRPLRIGPPPRLPSRSTDPTRRGWTAIETGLNVEAIKPAHDDDRLIVRLVNRSELATQRCPVTWGFPVDRVEPVDLLEQPTSLDGFAHDAAENLTVFHMRPFQIVTLAVTRVD